jgi:tetratricopeptide (TPR) repeat protein
MRKSGAESLGFRKEITQPMTAPTGTRRNDADRWSRVRRVFDAVADLEPAARAARLAEACGEDEELRREVESLLAFDRRSHDPIAHAVADAALAAAGGDPADDEIPSAIGRYRVLRKLGEGGMGRVFLAEDTSLRRHVALKVPSGALPRDPTMRGRLQHEARAAAMLSHPHVCVVHEVGEDVGGRPFIAMEYVEGETLAARLLRGPLPLKDVILLGRQAAGALAEAHGKGVVHRDLKPSNIMLTAHGIKLMDFGLAAMSLQSNDARGFMGTVPYMSPEQVRQEPLDGRSDLFSLGVVLYESATGRLPFEAATPQGTCEAILNRSERPPSACVDGLPADFDRMVARALVKNREQRFPDAAALAADLERLANPKVPQNGAAVRLARRHPIGLTAAALVVSAAAVFLYDQLTAPTPFTPAADHTVLLGGFANTTGDPTFDGTLDEALSVLLRQTPYVQVVGDTTVRETLQQMQRPATGRLSDEVAREICRRRGIAMWISASIAPAGHRFAITLAASDGRTGALIARERAEADSKVQVLGALGSATTRLRAALGEPPESLERFGAPVEMATTASLDALQAYALGVEQSTGGNYLVALSLFERAVQIDPEFAIAYQAIARERANLVYAEPLVDEPATRAFDLRARATEQERFAIEAFFHLSVTGDLERAIETNTRWAATYPQDWRPHHALGDLYNSSAHYEQSVDAARAAIRLNPDVAAAYSNLAGSLFALDRLDEARSVYREAMARGLDAPEYHAFLWRIAYYLGDADEMQRQLDWAAATSSWSFNMPALAAALQGRWRESQRLGAQARDVFERRRMPGLVAIALRYEALTGALVGDCDRARLDRAVAATATQSASEQARVGVALGLCGRSTDAARLAERLASGRSRNILLGTVWLPLVRAGASYQRDPRAAIEALEPIGRYEVAADSLPIYLRGLALLRLGDGRQARGEFDKIIAHRGRTFWFPLHPLAHLGRARALALTGDSREAVGAYRDFLTAWTSADADLPVMAAARAEHALSGSVDRQVTEPDARLPIATVGAAADTTHRRSPH